jgi:septal ring factor EnvC (AmiA/AmiB activator)
MSTPSGPSPAARPPLDSNPAGPNGGTPLAAEDPANQHKRPWAWIAAVVVLVLVAGGLAIWALGLNSDLSDQKDQTAKAQQESAQAKQEAEQANEDVSALQAQVDSITQAVNDAADQLSQTGAQAQENAQAALVGLKDKLASLKSQLSAAVAKLNGGAQATATPTAAPTEAQPTSTP